MTPRVLHLVPSLESIGMVRQMTLVCQQLASDGFQVGVYSLADTGPMAEVLQAAGVEVGFATREVGRPVRWLWQLDQQLDQFRPDVVHTWTGSAHTWGRLAALRRRIPRILASYRTLPRRESTGRLWLDRQLMRATFLGVANSRAAQTRAIEQGLPPEKLTVIPNGVLERPVATDLARRELRHQLGLAPETRLIGVAAPLQSEKRLKDLLWAIDLLHAIREDVHLVVLGDGPQRWRLERYAAQVHADERTHFLGWRLDAPELLAAVDCVWLAGARESCPNSLLEAMAAGVPVVAADCPGVREVVEPDVTGLVARCGDRGQIARLTHRTLVETSATQERVEAARERVRQEYSLEKMGDRYRELYRRVLYS